MGQLLFRCIASKDLKRSCHCSAGLLFFRHSENTTRFIDAWQQQLDADSKVGHAQG